ncbi:MAG: ice-binding family protein, partial [Anaerolineae bacterium]
MLKPIRLAAVLFMGIALLTATGSPLSQKATASRPSGTSPILVAAESYSVLGYSTVTNTGPTAVVGDLGVYPGSAVTGFPPGTVGPPGLIHAADGHAAAAQIDNSAAFSTLDQPCDFTYSSGQNLADLSPLAPGVYCALGSFVLIGNLTLTGSSGVWIFKSDSTLTTASGSSVIGGDPCNVWWRVGSSATLGTATEFRGNILAFASITLTSGANLNGRALAQNGAVTLDTNNAYLSCPVAPTETATSTG